MSAAHTIQPGLEAHPAAEIFPVMSDAEFQGLVADIREHGLREPIVLHEGKILDGRNRYRACQSIGTPARSIIWDQQGTTEAFVISHNLHRRHLNETQRAMIAARLATRKRQDTLIPGGPQSLNKLEVDIPTSSVSAGEAAAMLNVHRSSVFAAKKLIAVGTPAEITAAENGELSVNTVIKQILAGVPAEDRPKHSQQAQLTGKKKRAATVGANVQIWSQVRGALTNLTGLPLPDDVVRIVRGYDRADLVNKRLTKALKWLQEFSDVWNSGNHH